MPAKDPTAPRTPSGRKSRAKPGAVRGGSKPAGELPVRTRLTLHTTAPEAEAVKAAAKAAGLSESAWLRRAAQAELTRADHARHIAAHLDAMGGMPTATP